MNILKRLFLCLSAALLVGMAAGPVMADDAPSLVGTWQYQMTVHFDAPDCANSPEVPVGPNPFPALVSYHDGGTLNEFGARQPPSVRSTGFGSWKKTAKNRYRARDTFMEFDANGLLWRTMVIEKRIHLKPSGQKYTAVARLELTDVSGNVQNFCAIIDAQRFNP